MSGYGRPLPVGVVGCGKVSEIYVPNLLADEAALEVVACADLSLSRAEERSRQWDIRRTQTVAELLSDSSIELVVNLTPPTAHASITLAALENGKHVFTEKPLATTRRDCARIAEVARRRRRRVGGAPDTFLADGLQTARALIDEGAIGDALTACSFMMGPGHPARWGHPNPAYFYQRGAGPLLDIGPYQVSALVALLGPVTRVTGRARTVIRDVTIEAGPDAGQVIPVNVPLFSAAFLEFASGACGQLSVGWGVEGVGLPPLNVYGTRGAIVAPDPNGYDRTVLVKMPDVPQPVRIAPRSHNTTNGVNARGLGVREMAMAIREERPHRCSLELTTHVLDVLLSIEESARTGSTLPVPSRCERPPMLQRLA
jgi:predicted dehydrogenase